jgi:cytochrome c oxidase cbb3-type subunit III
MRATRFIGTVVCACGTLWMAGCERESRSFHERQIAAARADLPGQSQLAAGGPVSPTGTTSPFQQNAWGISEGKRLFSAYNCSGCHAHGGGGIGPPLMDDKWIYGYEAHNIFETIVEGRPDGMPSFRNKIPDYQVWQLVGYVQAMSAQVPFDAAPGRDEHMQVRRAEPITPFKGRIQTGHR